MQAQDLLLSLPSALPSRVPVWGWASPRGGVPHPAAFSALTLPRRGAETGPGVALGKTWL